MGRPTKQAQIAAQAALVEKLEQRLRDANIPKPGMLDDPGNWQRPAEDWPDDHPRVVAERALVQSILAKARPYLEELREGHSGESRPIALYSPPGDTWDARTAQVQVRMLRKALEAHDNDVAAVAVSFGLSRQRMAHILKQFSQPPAQSMSLDDLLS